MEMDLEKENLLKEKSDLETEKLNVNSEKLKIERERNDMKLRLESLDAIRMKYATEPVLNGNNYVLPKDDYLSQKNYNFNYSQSNGFGNTINTFNNSKFDNNNTSNFHKDFNTTNNFNNTNIRDTFNPNVNSNDFINNNLNNINEPMSQTYNNLKDTTLNNNINNSFHKPFNAEEYLNNYQNKIKNSQILNDSIVYGDNFLINEREYIKQSNESLNNVKKEYEQQFNEYLKQKSFSNPNNKYDDNENQISTSKQ